MSAVPVPFACAPLDDGSCPRPLPPSSLNSELMKSGLLCLVVIVVVAAAAAGDEEGEAAEVRDIVVAVLTTSSRVLGFSSFLMDLSQEISVKAIAWLSSSASVFVPIPVPSPLPPNWPEFIERKACPQVGFDSFTRERKQRARERGGQE